MWSKRFKHKILEDKKKIINKEVKIMDKLTELVMDKVAKLTEKRRSDITRSFNSIYKKTKEEFSEMNIPDNQLEKMALYGLGDRWKITKENMSGLIEDSSDGEKVDEIFEEDDDEEDISDISLEDIEEELDLGDDITIASPPVERESEGFDADNLKDLFNKAIKRSDEKAVDDEKFEKLPSLIQIYNAVYTMELLYPDDLPYEHYNEQYKSNSYVFKVLLHKVSPDDFYEERYEKGDLKGKKMFVKGNKYSIWLSETALASFGRFWKKVNKGNCDTRKFKFIKKKIGKKRTAYKITSA